MPEFTRTVVQRYTVNGEDMVGFEATALIEGLLEALAPRIAAAGVKVGRPVIADTYGDEPGGEDAMYAILGDAQIPDEVENANGACFVGLVRVDDTDIPERLLAWRDAAVRRALQAAHLEPPATGTAASPDGERGLMPAGPDLTTTEKTKD